MTTVGAALPPGLPEQLAHQIQVVAHDVFVYGYIEAMHATLLVPIAALCLAMLSCTMIRRRSSETEADAGRLAPAGF